MDRIFKQMSMFIISLKIIVTSFTFEVNDSVSL